MVFNSPKFLFSVSSFNSSNNPEFRRLYEFYLNSPSFQVSGLITSESKDGNLFTKFNVYGGSND